MRGEFHYFPLAAKNVLLALLCESVERKGGGVFGALAKGGQMNREEYFKFHEEMTRRMNVITKQKNADYTGAAGDDPFANFNRVASLGVCSTEQGFMVRMLDKYMRINSFVQKGFLNVKDESVEDTLLDLANYAILFAGYLRSQKRPSDVFLTNEQLAK